MTFPTAPPPPRPAWLDRLFPPRAGWTAWAVVVALACLQFVLQEGKRNVADVYAGAATGW